MLLPTHWVEQHIVLYFSVFLLPLTLMLDEATDKQARIFVLGEPCGLVISLKPGTLFQGAANERLFLR